jgi:hypothetical protein
VNVTTNSGTDQYHGNLEVVSDNLAGEFGYDSFDQNWYSADFGGPIPGLERGSSSSPVNAGTWVTASRPARHTMLTRNSD